MLIRRVQFSISDADAAALDRLAEQCGTSTVSELLRNAVVFYRWCLEKASEGYKIEVTNSDSDKVFVPILLGMTGMGKH